MRSLLRLLAKWQVPTLPSFIPDLGSVHTTAKMTVMEMVRSCFAVHTSRFITWACRAVKVTVTMAATATAMVTVGKEKSVKYERMTAPYGQPPSKKWGGHLERKLANTYAEPHGASAYNNNLILQSSCTDSTENNDTGMIQRRFLL